MREVLWLALLAVCVASLAPSDGRLDLDALRALVGESPVFFSRLL